MLVGAQLRRPRTDKGLSREQVGEASRSASAWKIHRLENGQVGFEDSDIADLLPISDVTDPDAAAAFMASAHD